MNFVRYKEHIAGIMKTDSLGLFLPDWINSVRDEICQRYKFSFQIKERIVTPVAGTYAYAFDPGDNSDRYAMPENILFTADSTAVPVVKSKLQFANRQDFDLFVHNAAGTPQNYKVMGRFFYVDFMPNPIGNQRLYVRYYMLPNILSADDDFAYIDERHYQAAVFGVCCLAAKYLDPPRTAFFQELYEKEFAKMVALDTGAQLNDTTVRPNLPLGGLQ